MKNKIILGLCSAAALALATNSAHAFANQDAIRFSLDGTTWITTVVDVGGTGTISTSFSGNGFTLSIVGSLTYPALGTQASPQMDLSILGVTGAAGNKVWVEFSAIGFEPVPPGSFVTTVISSIGAGGSQAETTRVGANSLFADPGTSMSPITLTGLGQVGSSTGVAPGQPSPYSITIREVITSAGAGGVISTDENLHVPDGGNTLMLLGSALSVLGFGVFRKSRKA